MNTSRSQLALFQSRNLNIVYEIKRQIRLALSGTSLSRDQVIDAMNRLTARDGIHGQAISRATLDSWCKDSEPGRLPGLSGLLLFCHVLGTLAPAEAWLSPLGVRVIGEEKARLLAWAEAEQARKKATRRARLALEGLEQ